MIEVVGDPAAFAAVWFSGFAGGVALSWYAFHRINRRTPRQTKVLYENIVLTTVAVEALKVATPEERENIIDRANRQLKRNLGDDFTVGIKETLE